MEYQAPPETEILYSLLEETAKKKDWFPLRIVETGIGGESTATIADWIRGEYDTFNSVSLDAIAQEECHRKLEGFDLAVNCVFRTQSPIRWLSDQSWIDFALLHPDSLDDGIQQFSLAMSAGAKTIAIFGYQQTAASAVRKARSLGWTFETSGDYSILRRP